ncbi:hypothetical protein [Rhodobium gokarnense]|uniref:3-keto-disaccharide hydrolase domain-containing protein n=1 Tax=Rhodobium gokarnense TaxID=364296 RepID=A0ABT3HCB3_9HYPH|nr:hypothetical protein [Rhodobium gokarnense]MCW2308049.1 hypothetical protein [Rhodobium gokarnense]
MSIFKRVSILAAIVASASALAPDMAFSQETASGGVARSTYKEDFNGADRMTMLGGQINFASTKSSWFVSVIGGKLIFENRTNPNLTHYNEINWVKYEGTSFLSSTHRATISVTVDAANEGRGGAGILVGSAGRGHHWMFCIDRQGRYYVFTKNRGKLQPAFGGRSNAVTPDEPNRVTYEWQDNRIAFFVNGVEVIQVPFDARKGEQVGIALTAFGLGTYRFDDLEISKKN